MIKKLTCKKLCTHLLLIFICAVMLYPFVWMIMGAFKSNEEIFGSVKLLPASFAFEAFTNGWKGNGQVGYLTFFINTFRLTLPTVLFTVLSSTVVAYGFARFTFSGKKLLFSIVIGTLLLPNSIVIIPRYLLYNRLGWLNSYKSFYASAILAANPFFIFLMTQFLRGISRELDEAARIDGCGSLQTLVRIIVPLCKPAMFSVAIFQFVWTWNDFLNPLIYINSVKNYPLSLALKMSVDISGTIHWNQVLAMSVLSIIPGTVLFFLAQNYFVEGIATTGIKE